MAADRCRSKLSANRAAARPVYSLLLGIIYVAFISLGLLDSLVGAGWPVMHKDLDVPVSFAGFITMIIAGGTIVSSLASARITRKFGAGPVTAFSVGLTAAALVGFSGLGWSRAYLAVGAIQAVLTFLLLVSLPLWGRVNRVPPGEQDADADAEPAPGQDAAHVSLAQALRIPGAILILTAFFAYCALESTTILWASTYLVGDRGVAVATAATFGSLFLLGITAGRFLAGFFADRVGDKHLIRGGFLTVIVAAVMIALPLGTPTLALVALVLAGLGCAPIYPAIIHSTPVNFGRENSQAIIGIQMAAAYIGSTLAPPLFGALSTVTGLWILPLLLAVLAALGLLMFERLNQLASRRRQPSESANSASV